ncbi:MAG TPA: BON domain-containing protein [Xanthomonadaceae bacterium]|nr:BON domain-containing protein [Xanthomonadaceae bacterium]
MNTTMIRRNVFSVALAAAFALPFAATQPVLASDQPEATQRMENAAITASVKTRLIADERTRGFDINVDTKGQGKVVLRGTAPSESSLKAAEEIARSVSGVSEVQNDLIVAPPGSVAERSAPPATATQHVRRAAQDAGEAGSDAWITTKVKAALLADREVSGFAIQVETRDGVVHLEGEVDDERIEARAVELAANVAGVRRVETDRLRTKS